MAVSVPKELATLLDAPSPEAADPAWAGFLKTYSPILLATARKFGRTHDAALDRYSFILEELRRDDFKRLRNYAVDRRSRFSTWLVVVARRLCLDYGRVRYGRDRGSGRGTEAGHAREVRRRLADLIAEELDPAATADERAGAEARVREQELHSALGRIVASLSRRDRLLLKLRYEDDRSVREIATIMHFPSVFHVYRRLRPLHDEIRRQLRQSGFDGATP